MSYPMSEFINVEDAESVDIGKTYAVNCVPVIANPRPWMKNLWSDNKATFIPVMGPRHEDKEFLKFPRRHYHVDWRFAPARVYQAALAEATERIREGTLQMARDGRLRPVASKPEQWILAFAVIKGECTNGDPPKRFALQCRRSSAVFPAEAEWMAGLEAAYVNSRARNNVCPHRGISLAGAPEDSAIPGSAVCMGHGLCFDKQTGALRRRANKDFERLVSAK